MAITIRDVAAAAGVSITTVSHVLNGKGRTSARVRKAVLEAVREVGYQVDPLARSLRTGKTGVIGIIFRPHDAIPGSMNGTEYHIKLAGGAAAAALSRGYGLLHLPYVEDGRFSLLPMDGCVVVAPYRDDPLIAYLQDRDMPFVLADPDPSRPDFPQSVRRDDYGGMIQLLDHMTANGARDIAFFSGSDENNWLSDTGRAYDDWTRRHGRAPLHSRLTETDGAEAARRLASSLLADPQHPDALIVATTRFAEGVVAATRALGMTLPQDLMLATLSDSEIARSNDVPVTALNLHGDRMGRTSVQILLNRLEAQETAPPEDVRPTLIVRASTLRGMP